jgi:formylglycine-generating enzyme required for sulfatase activity
MDEVNEGLSGMGFEVTRVSDPRSDQLRNAFQDFINAHGYGAGNRLLFFYSGHGHSRDNGTKGYLVPTNAPDPRRDETGFLRTALPMSQIHAWCRQMEAKHALFLFDSCFSGSVFRTKALPDTPPHITASTSKPVRQFISAGSADQQVPAKSVFQPLFLRGLRGAADLSRDGYITGTELGLYLSQEVPQYDRGQTPQFGKMRDPDLDEGDFVLVSPASGPTAVTPPAPPERPRVSPIVLPEAERLLQELMQPDATDARRRAIGIRLSDLGDPRPGVGVRSGVPDVEWVSVSPGGSVDIAGSRKSVSPFYIARHEVTYGQYEAFVEASDGFDNPQWWQGMPSKYRPPNKELNAQKNSLLNAPRENVSWYQAVAFTRWLSARLKAKNASVSAGGVRVSGVDWEARLPTEWEWQWAAQGGSKKRGYPWGSWRAGRANAAQVLDSTTAVGMYPEGAAASGALDMSGNVWEWCLNKYESPYSTAVDTSNDYRALRGGSFFDSREGAACAVRDPASPPNARVSGLGFRVGLFSPQ